jgi:TRAP-type C4-dicarboxylate transport system permease small subunit
MRVTLISERLPVKAQRVLTVFIDLCTLFLFLILGIKGIEVVQSLEGMDLITMPIPRGIVFAAAPAGAVLMILVLLPILIEDVKVLFLPAQERSVT